MTFQSTPPIASRIGSDEFDTTGTAGEIDSVVRRPNGLLSRDEMAQFSARSNTVGLTYLFINSLLIAVGAYGLILSAGTLWMLPVFAIHAIIIGFLFSPLHECAHGTAFASRWLNDTALWLVSLVYIVPPYFFRYFHLGHHRYTQVPGKDPSLVLPEPANLRQYIWYCAGLWFWWRNLAWMAQHALGTVSPASELYVPKAKRLLLVREARIMMAFLICVLSIGWFSGVLEWLVIAWIAPRIVGEPVQRMIRVAEHVGCEESENLLANTRTTRLVNTLAWQMPFHAKHHLFPNVPFFRLPDVHEKVAQDVVVEPRGYLRGQWDIITKLRASTATGWAGSKATL
jgi:fatty acid desaturase